MSVGWSTAVFVPKCFPAVLQPLQGWEERSGSNTRQEKKKNTYGLEEGKKTVTEEIEDFFFPPLIIYICVYIIMAGQGGDLITVLYLAN